MTKQNQQLLVAAALVAATSVWSAAQAPQPATPRQRGNRRPPRQGVRRRRDAALRVRRSRCRSS